jgi:hypothetical protein
VKSVGKPDAGNRHVRFDERGGETGRLPVGLGTALLLDSTQFSVPSTGLPAMSRRRPRKKRKAKPIPGMTLKTQEQTDDAVSSGAGFRGVLAVLRPSLLSPEPIPKRQSKANFRRPPLGCRPMPSRLILTTLTSPRDLGIPRRSGLCDHQTLGSCKPK